MNPIPLSPKRAEAAVRAFKGKRLLVLGDIMLDKYIWGGVSRISPEAPVPVVEVQKSTSALGGAGNVGQNLAALGASPLLVGVVGDDPEGAWIRKRLGESRGIVVDPDRPTTVKTRIIAHHQQVVRVDQERKQPFAPATEAKIAQILRREKAEGILISDYNKGVVTKSLMAAVLPRAQADGRPVFVDPKVENFALYTPVTFLSPNHHEAERIVNHPCQTEAEVERAGREIMGRLATLYLIIKRGEQGMSIFERGKTPVHIPTIAREVFDVTGAGDTVLAAAALALLAGLTIREAAVLANAAAGVVVGKLGTAVCSPDELLASLRRII